VTIALRIRILRAVSNIIEGSERNRKADYNRFLSITCGFAAELRTRLYSVSEIGTIDAWVDMMNPLQPEVMDLDRRVVYGSDQSKISIGSIKRVARFMDLEPFHPNGRRINLPRGTAALNKMDLFI
jgi:hypothetical protein